MKTTGLRQSTNIQDIRAQNPKPKAPSRNPFSYAQDRETVNPGSGGGYNGPSNVKPIKNNPFQSQIDAIQSIGEAGAKKLKTMIGQDIGKLNRTDENGYNIRSRARTGALRPNTRSS